MLSWGLGAHTGPSAHRGHFAVLSIGTKNAPFWLSRQIIFWLIFLSSPEAPEHSLFCGGREQRKKKKKTTHQNRRFCYSQLNTLFRGFQNNKKTEFSSPGSWLLFVFIKHLLCCKNVNEYLKQSALNRPQTLF